MTLAQLYKTLNNQQKTESLESTALMARRTWPSIINLKKELTNTIRWYEVTCSTQFL